jgi:hypothetical protein
MERGAILLICVLVPLAGAFLLPLVGRISARLRNYCALAMVLASLTCSLALVPDAVAGKIVAFQVPGPLGISFSLSADALAVFMAVVSSLVGALIMLFSFDYISHYENQNEYYLMAVLFLGSMMGLVLSAPIAIKAPRRIPEGEAVSRYEAPRGEDVHYVKGNGSEKPERVKVRAPTLANTASVAKMLEDGYLADLPIVIAAIDPCFSCTDRMVALRDGGESEGRMMSWEEVTRY